MSAHSSLLPTPLLAALAVHADGCDYAHDARPGHYPRIVIPRSHGPRFRSIDAREDANDKSGAQNAGQRVVASK
jgi:hypothetical protein